MIAAALKIPAQQRDEDVKKFSVWLAFGEAKQRRKRLANIELSRRHADMSRKCRLAVFQQSLAFLWLSVSGIIGLDRVLLQN
ncbi:hypothetical protein [Leptothoe sp. PORK10 BA2]|uniref:hypothetical protein n=1 Tax=Leptothoe sp. PORK10 BA2 TaxID=3110254 RepID=UPI002B1F24D8|nr:hypothetical protein [Leptothoe sp. PORK10 BA2]MEA5467189.1 hypothetical protein [Leptothoe sp. PORK10 BA2]